MNKGSWTDEELKQLSALVAAGGTAFRAAAKFNRSIIACRNQARAMGTPFTHIRITRMNVRVKCEAAKDVSEVSASSDIGVAKTWSAKFNHPIRWGANTLRTLNDARDYIFKLPNSKQMLPAWQAASDTLLQAAEHGGFWLELARIGVMQALLGPKPITESSASNQTHWERRELTRDR